MKEGKVINYNENNERYTVRIINHEYNLKSHNLIKICLYKNDSARTLIQDLNINSDDVIYINQWLIDKKVKCYVLEKENTIMCFVLLSEMDYDPLKEYMKPFTLNFIYTFPEYRRNNLAYYLLNYIKTKEQLTAFTSNDTSDQLFKKSNYKSFNLMGSQCFRSI